MTTRHPGAELVSTAPSAEEHRAIFARSKKIGRSEDKTDTPKRARSPDDIDPGKKPKRVPNVGRFLNMSTGENQSDQSGTESESEAEEPQNSNDDVPPIGQSRTMYEVMVEKLEYMAKMMKEAADAQVDLIKDKKVNPEVRKAAEYTATWAARVAATATRLAEMKPPIPESPKTPEEQELEEAEDIRRRIGEAKCSTDDQELMKRKWPVAAFRTTHIKRKSIANSACTTRIITAEELRKEGPIRRAMLAQFPSIQRSLNGKRMVTLTSTETINEDGAEEQNDTRRLIIVDIGDGSSDDLNQKAMEVARSLVDKTSGEPEIDMLAPARGLFQWRKALEIAIGNAQMNVTLCSTRREGPAAPRATNPAAPNGRVVIKAEGRTFAQIVGSIQNAIKGGEPGVPTITRIERTESGDARIRVAGSRGEAEALSKKLETTIRGVTVEDSRTKAVVVSNLMEGCTNEEVTASVCRALDDSTLMVKVLSLRPAYGNTMRAVVLTGETQANKLVAMGRIRVGLIAATVRVRPQRCRRCWEPEHKGKCKGPDKSRLCFQCQGVGHRKADCKVRPSRTESPTA